MPGALVGRKKKEKSTKGGVCVCGGGRAERERKKKKHQEKIKSNECGVGVLKHPVQRWCSCVPLYFWHEQFTHPRWQKCWNGWRQETKSFTWASPLRPGGRLAELEICQAAPREDTRNRGDSKDVLNRRIEIMEILFILSAVVKVCMLKYASRRKEMDPIPTRGSAVCICLQSSWVYAVSWWKVTASWWANIFVECGGTSENIEFLSA